MKKLFIYLLIFFAASFPVFSQTVFIKGKVFDEKKNPVKNLNIRFTGVADIVTTGQGEFILELPSAVNQLNASVSNSEYKILYPVDGNVAVPGSADIVLNIVVSKEASSNENSVNDLVKKYNEMKTLLGDLGVTQNELVEYLKKFVEIESARIETDEKNLRDAIERSKRREEIYPVLSSAMLNYLLKAQNIKNYFKNTATMAFMDIAAHDQLAEALIAYNKAFNEINNNRLAYINDVTINWNKSIAEELNRVNEYALDEIHLPHVLRLNEAINSINKILRGHIDSRSERDNLRASTIKLIDSVTTELDIRLQVLDRRINTLLNEMKETNIN
jgi:tetratricopeptide (TPR) repeat protein